MEVVENNGRLNYELLQYNFAGVKATENSHFLSLANDKGNVGGLHLSGGVVVLPNNCGFVAPPQVIIGMSCVSLLLYFGVCACCLEFCSMGQARHKW